MSGEKLLQDRLQQQSGGFSSLLSLIPAKMYYGEENTDQWNKKKQTKAEAKAARRAKLDPDSELNRNAKEIMDERARNKRKAREMEEEEEEENDDNDDQEDDDDSFQAIDGIDAEKPGEGLKKKASESNKKQKRADNDEDAEEEDWEDEEDEDEKNTASEPQTKLSKKEEKRAAKVQKRKEKKAEKKAKQSNKPDETSEPAPTPAKKSKKDKKTTEPEPAPSKDDEAEDDHKSGDAKLQNLDFSGLAQEEDAPSVATSDPQSPTFDTNTPNDGTPADAASASTSVSSTVPPSEKPKHIKLPTDTSHLKARFEAKIAALRAARKADGPDGKPIRTRQELIEARRAKEAKRKAHKQDLRQQARLEEQRKREEALASNSPSIMSPAVERADSPGTFAFGRVAFGDGSQLSHDLSYVLNNNAKKGPTDPKQALIKVQAQKKRLEELDAEKREDIAEKDKWLTMRRRAEGEKIRDDETILKKAVKRKEVAKKKSEKAWKDRQEGVKQAQKDRQKKREDNIRKRREEKMLGKAGKKKKGGAKKGGRPGFEGSSFGGKRK